MRKWVWLYAVVLFVVMATPAGARRVANEGDSGFEVAAYVGEGLTTSGPFARTAGSGQGWVSVNETRNGLGFNLEYSAYFGCEGVSGNEAYLESMSASGNGWIDEEVDANHVFVIDPRNGPDKFMLGEAKGTFAEGSLSYVYCDGSGFQGELSKELAGASFTLHMDGVGYVYKTSDSGSFHIPGVQNDHYMWRGEYRQSYGSVGLGVEGCDEPCTFFTDGGIGKWSYSSHGNSH